MHRVGACVTVEIVWAAWAFTVSHSAMEEWLVPHQLTTHKVILFAIFLKSRSQEFRFLGGSNYPGVVTDLIREVRDAGRIRDESLMNRVKALVDEKSWNLNESNMRVLRDLEEVKVRFKFELLADFDFHCLNLGPSSQFQAWPSIYQRQTFETRGWSSVDKTFAWRQQQLIPAILEPKSWYERSSQTKQYEH